MANVLTTGAWLSAPTKKSSFFARLLRNYLEFSERRADRVVETYIATHGLQPFAFQGGPLTMVTLIVIQVATKLARFGKEVRETWRETQRLRRSLDGPTEE